MSSFSGTGFVVVDIRKGVTQLGGTAWVQEEGQSSIQAAITAGKGGWGTQPEESVAERQKKRSKGQLTGIILSLGE